MKKILFCLLILWPGIVFCQEKTNDTREMKPVVYLIGSVHNMHFNPDNHYTVNDLLAQVCALHPDLVCGEITPEAFQQPMEGYFPPEAAFLAEMAPLSGYRFVPVDWRLDRATQSLANTAYPESVNEQSAGLVNYMQGGIKNLKEPSLYDFMHSPATIHNLDSLYEQIICTNPLSEIASGSWRERNRRIVENGLAAAGDARVIVFVFGIDHLPQIQRQLKAMGIEAQIPGRKFVPGNDFHMKKAVLDRWKRNRENLILIREQKMQVPLDSYKKVVNSKRVEDFDEAIQKSL